MPERTREPQNNAKSIDRWDNEGGAPSGGDRSARKRPRDTYLQKKPRLRRVQRSRLNGPVSQPVPELALLAFQQVQWNQV